MPVDTFTWGKRESYDRRFAQRVAEVYSTTHHDCDYEYEKVIDRYHDSAIIAEGMNNTFECHMLMHLHILEGASNLNLDGFAGDVVLGGSFLRRAWNRQSSHSDLAKALFSWRNVLLPEADLNQVMPDPSRIEAEDMPSAQHWMLLGRYQELPGGYRG